MSAFIIPILAIFVIVYGLIKRVDVYDAFITGAAKSVPLLVKILPYIAAMLIALSVFRSSGALDILIHALSPALNAVGLPPELAPLTLLRPFSGSASLAMLSDVFANYNVDTFIGFAASIIIGSTETIFYTISVYFGSVRIIKTRHAVPVALLSGIVSVAAALLCAYLFWNP